MTNENIDKSIMKFSTTKLCQVVISSRYLGSLTQEAILCMQELASRRAAGEMFDYELFINDELKKLPDFKMNIRKKMQIGALDLATLRNIK